jgi:hypothetical protein
MFLLQPEEQRRLIQDWPYTRAKWRLLFTSPLNLIVWNDAMTGLSHDRLARSSIEESLLQLTEGTN